MRSAIHACLLLALPGVCLAGALVGALAGSAAAQLDRETPLFTSLQWAPAGTTAVTAGYVDFDGDGLLDVCSVYDSSISGQRFVFMAGDGELGWGWTTSDGVPDVQPCMGFGDVDGDRQLDGFVPTAAGDVLFLRGVWSIPSGHAYVQVVELELSASTRASLAVGDLTGDGLADALVSRGDDDLLSVVTSDGADSVLVGPSVAVPGGPGRLALGDLDGDGWLDALVATEDGGALVELRGVGDGLGGLAPHAGLPLADGLGPVALGDWNGDGLLDVVTAGQASGGDTGTLALFGESGGGFSAPQLVCGGGLQSALAVADLDRDGLDDLVVSRVAGDGVAIALGSPSGLVLSDGFPWYDAPLQPGDLDGDGVLDLLSTRWRGSIAQGVGSPSVHEVLLGRGDGGFARPTHVPGPAPVDLFVRDLDGDGALDVLTTESLTHTAWLGDGAGGFSAQAAEAGRLLDAVLTQLDGDGVLDVVHEQPAPAGVELRALLGDGDGSFSLAWSLQRAGPAVRLAVADATGDGVGDLLRLPAGSTWLEVYPGLGDGTFGAALLSDVEHAGSDMGAGDLDGDGDLDLLVTGDVLGDVDLYTRLGNGDGAFVEGPVQGWGVTQLPELALHDLDEDGRLDAVLMPALAPGSSAYNQFGDLELCRGLPAGAFDKADDVDRVWSTSRQLFVDLDGDGHAEHVSATPFATSVGVRRGDGGFGLPPAEEFGVGDLDGDWTALDAGDVDGDGRPDLVVGTRHGFAVLPQLVPDAWVGHGRALPGDTSPSLVLGGSLQPGSTLAFSLVDGPAFGTAWLVLGAEAWTLPFKGGWLVPAPQLLAALPLDPDGRLEFDVAWPPGVAPGTSTWWQCWMPDASGVWGWVASNALEGITP